MIACIESNRQSNGVTTDPLLQKVSASRLNTFHQCRLKFYFRYVLKLQKAKTPALHIGTTVHAVLQFWNKARWRKDVITLEIVREHFAKHWVEGQEKEPVNWDGEEPEEMEATWKLVQTYLQQTPIPLDEKPEAVEVQVEAPLSDHGLPMLVGVIDLVRSGGRIVDFKTIGQTPNTEKSLHLHETQLSCYAILYREATGHPEGGFELHNLVKTKTPKIVIATASAMDQKQEARLFRSIESFFRGIECQDWVPSPSPMSCACCEFYNECRAFK